MKFGQFSQLFKNHFGGPLRIEQILQDLKVIGQIFEVLTSTEKLGEQQSESRQGLELKSFREESL